MNEDPKWQGKQISNHSYSVKVFPISYVAALMLALFCLQILTMSWQIIKLSSANVLRVCVVKDMLAHSFIILGIRDEVPGSSSIGW